MGTTGEPSLAVCQAAGHGRVVLVRRADEAVTTGPPRSAIALRFYSRTPEALALYRVLYALGSLWVWRTLPSEALGSLPDFFYFGPVGPMQLIGGFPSAAILAAIEAGAVIALVALLIGYRTRLAGLSFTGLALLQGGLRYSTGKIDHELVIIAVPLVLSFSAWGDRFSVDQWRRQDPGGDARRSTYALAALALLLGTTFATSGAVKALTGWLDTRGSAVWGWAVTYQDYGWPVNDINSWLVPRYSPAWEALDYITVGFELGFLAAALSGRWLRPYLVLAVGFHIGILLLFGIDFGRLLLVYLAFAPLQPAAMACRRALDWFYSRLARLPSACLGLIAGGFGSVIYFGELPTLLRAFEGRVLLYLGTGFWLLFAVLVGCLVAMALRFRRPTAEVAPAGGDVRLERRVVLAVTAIVVAPFLVLVAWSEPYPAPIGPLFAGVRAQGNDAVVLRQEVWIEGPEGRRDVTPGQLFGAGPHFSTNLQNYRFPAPVGAAQAFTPLPNPPSGRLGELGHRFRATRFSRPPIDLTEQERAYFAQALDARPGDVLVVQWTRVVVSPVDHRLVEVQSSVISDLRWPLTAPAGRQ